MCKTVLGENQNPKEERLIIAGTVRRQLLLVNNICGEAAVCIRGGGTAVVRTRHHAGALVSRCQ